MIYFDHAATTPIDKRVLEVMKPYFIKEFGNPSSIYSLGHRARIAIDQAREKIAKILNCQPSEITFTAGGTESCNLAILGVARAYSSFVSKMFPEKKPHLIISAIEHHAVSEPAVYLKKNGWEVSILPVKKDGIVEPEELKRALREETLLVSIMYANNEIGTIQPIKEMSKIIRKFRQEMNRDFFKEPPFFHTDACQAAGYLDLDVQHLGVDLMTINGSKIYGPKGIGVLYHRREIRIEPLIYGGGQENGLRSGTENVPAIVGLAKALELVEKEKEKENYRLTKLRDYLIKGILESIPKSFLNGDPIKRLPNNVNVTILDIEGEALILHLSEKGIMASTGSACSSSTLEPSHVLLALGLPPAVAHGSLRLTLGRTNTKKDIDYFLKILSPIVKKLRAISPVKLKFYK
jgi:cysteine desulfurase